MDQTPAPEFYRLLYKVRGLETGRREQRFDTAAEAWAAYHATPVQTGDWLYLEAAWHSDHGAISATELTKRIG